MLKIGCHLSCSEGYAEMGKKAVSLGANVFQFFSRNPRGAKAKTILLEDVNLLKQLMKEHNFGKLLIHAPYTVNICSNNQSVRDFSYKMILEDIQILDKYLPGNLYNLHPGYRLQQELSTAIYSATTLLNDVLAFSMNTMILLETMSGKGSEVGSTFEEIKNILLGIKFPEKVGICLDTCHVFTAGYNITDKLDEVLEHFDKTIGLSKLFAIHLNDSAAPFFSRKDKHASLGKGYIGLKAIESIINHKKLKNIPLYLETPNNKNSHIEEINLIKSLYKNV